MHQGVIHKFREFVQERADRIARQQPYIEICLGFRGDDIDAHARLQHRWRNRIAHHRVPQRIGVRENALGVLAAIGRIHHAHPLAGFLVLECRQAFKVAPRNRGKVNRRRVIADLGHRRGQVHHGIIFRGYGGVSGPALGNHGDIHGHFFIRLHGHMLHLAVFHHHLPAFVDGITGGEFVPILGDERLQAGVAKLLFIGCGQENDVAI